MFRRILKSLFAGACLCPLLVNYTEAQQPYQPRVSDPLEDKWRWQRLPELGSHSRSIEFNDSGQALILKKSGDDRIFLFDGVQLTDLVHPSSVNDQPVRVIFGPKNEILMFADGGIYEYQGNQWVPLVKHSLQLNPNADIVSEGNGRYWMSGTHGIIEFDGQQVIRYGFDEIPSSGVHDLVLGSDNALWMVVGPTGDVYRCPIVDGALLPERQWEQVYESERDFVHQSWIYATRQNQIWVVNNHEHDGAMIYDIEAKTWEMHSLRTLGGENFSTSLAQTYDDRVWVIGRGSLHGFDGESWKVFKGPEYPIPDGWPNITQDADGYVYVLESGAGMTRIDYPQKQFRTLLGLHFQTEGLDGNFWYLDVEGHVVMENRSSDRWYMFPVEETGVDAPVNLIALDNGHILVAGSSNEAASFSVYNGLDWERYRFPEFAPGLSHQGILKLKNGDVILSCGQPQNEYPDIVGGMLRISYQNGQYVVQEHDSVQSTFRPWTVAEDPVDGSLWVGANRLSKVEFNIPFQNVSYPGDNWVDSLAVAKNQDLWMVLWGSGVFRYRDGEWLDMSAGTLLEGRHYSHVLLLNGEDPVVATDEGIFRFDGESWAPFATPGLSLHRVGGTLKQSEDGSFWVNETHTDWYYRGLKTEAYPEVKKKLFRTVQVLPDRAPPRTRMVRDGNPVFSSRKASLRWRGSDYWSKTHWRSLTYSYSINDGPWSPFSSERRLERSDWSDGVHTLRIRARDSDFNIELQPAVHTFEIILPIWQKTWAQVTMGLIVILIFSLITVVIRQRLKHLLELERIKLHFFTNISHELRTPLTLILGPVEKMLIEDEGNTKRHSYLRTIQTNTNRLLYLIDQLLDFRRVEKGRLRTEQRVVDLVALIKNVMETFDFVVKEKKQSLSFKTPFELCRFSFDEDSFYKIIDNLIHNAIKYTPPGGKIQIELNPAAEDVKSGEINTLCLRVQDTGMGVAPELIDNIFEPFYRGSNEAGKMKQGVGIGLALVKELVDVVKGSIDVTSPVPETEQGTRFTVRFPVDAPEVAYRGEPLPAIAQDNESQEVMDDGEGEAESVIRRAHIHLVEDNPDVLQFLRSELSEQYEVSTSENGLEGESYALENLPDLIITDVMMPKQDGFGLCKHLKTNPATSHIPIIMLTAFKTRHHEEEGLAYGADDYIGKPVSIKLLRLKINNLLTQQERLRERIRLEYGLLPASTSEIRAVDKQFLDNAEEITTRFLGDEFFGVEQFAEEMGMSRSNFYKKFRDLTGMSPASYVKVKRLNESARRIEVGQGNITEIAFDVGFSDVSYFSRCFKEHFGCPPSKYSAQKSEETRKG